MMIKEKEAKIKLLDKVLFDAFKLQYFFFFWATIELLLICCFYLVIFFSINLLHSFFDSLIVQVCVWVCLFWWLHSRMFIEYDAHYISFIVHVDTQQLSCHQLSCTHLTRMGNVNCEVKDYLVTFFFFFFFCCCNIDRISHHFVAWHSKFQLWNLSLPHSPWQWLHPLSEHFQCKTHFCNNKILNESMRSEALEKYDNEKSFIDHRMVNWIKKKKEWMKEE